MNDHPRACPHGRQWGTCNLCRIAELEAEVARLDDNLRRRGAPPEERRADIDDRYKEPEG